MEFSDSTCKMENIYMFPAISICLILKSLIELLGVFVKYKNLIWMGHVFSAQLKTLVTQF